MVLLCETPHYCAYRDNFVNKCVVLVDNILAFVLCINNFVGLQSIAFASSFCTWTDVSYNTKLKLRTERNGILFFVNIIA